jgi:hypothetical protein
MRHVADDCGDRLGRARLQRCPRATKSNDLRTSTWTLVGAGLGARIAATLSDFRRDGEVVAAKRHRAPPPMKSAILARSAGVPCRPQMLKGRIKAGFEQAGAS